MSGCATCGGYGMHHDPVAHGTGWHDEATQQAAALDYAETALGEAYDVLRRIVKGTEDPRKVAADFLEAHGFQRASIDPIGWAADVYKVPRELVEGARDHLETEQPYRGDCTATMRLTQVDPDVEIHAWCTLEDGHDGWHRTRRLSWPQLDPDSWEPLP